MAQLQAALPFLQAQLPQLSVISANIQPVAMAILEGEQEIIFTPDEVLEETFNGIPLYIRPHSFFQTNPAVAAQLYHTAGQWVRELGITRLWDLFCGAGGFGLHCADKSTQLTGLKSARSDSLRHPLSGKMGLENVTFQALDSAQFALGKSAVPELVLVNPPRRGSVKRCVIILIPWHRRRLSIPVAMHRARHRTWRISHSISRSACSCLICSRIPHIMKCWCC